MNRFKFVLTALLIVVIIVTSLPLHASAQSKFSPFLTTTRMYAKNGKSGDYVINSPYQIFVQKGIDFSKKAELKSSFDTALKSGDWVVTQYVNDAGTVAMVRLYWTETKSTKAVLRYDAGVYFFGVSSESWKSIDLNLYESGKPYVIRATSSPSTIELSRASGTGFSTRTVFATPKYTKHKSLDGHDVLIPKAIDDPRQPDFAWDINDRGELFVIYMENDKKLNDHLDHCKARWQIDEVDVGFKTVIVAGVYNDLVPIAAHSHRFERRGFFKLKITVECDIHPPMLPYDHSYIRPVIFNIPFDGSFHRGSTFRNCDSHNNCSPEPIDCSQLTGIARTACNMNTRFNFGVLNPSLLAIRSLVSSFLVPADPSCGITIPAVGNKVVDSYSPSKAVDQACRLSAEIRPRFPLLVILTNFVVALFLFWLIVRAINNLLDHRQDDVVGSM